MDDDRGLGHRGGSHRAGPPQAGLPGLPAAVAPGGHARERTVRDLHGTSVTARPDRARWPACRVTHVVLEAGLLPRRAYAGRLIGQALVAAARGSGHRRIALDLDVPAGTVRGWIRGARRSAAGLRVTGIRAAVRYDQDAVPAPSGRGELRWALECLGAAGRCHRPPPRPGARQPVGDDQRPDGRPAAGYGPGRLNPSAVPGSRLP
jgi:hypothetical protein